MKKIINGKQYNTETAERKGSWEHLVPGDFGWVEETLYQKRTGEFFLHGQGGANTKYARQTETSSWTGGQAITPVTYEGAREWAEERLTADEYEAIFGEVVEDDSKTIINLSISAHAAEKAKREAAAAGISVSSWVEGLIRRETS